jgi:hypothetical protein
LSVLVYIRFGEFDWPVKKSEAGEATSTQNKAVITAGKHAA